MLDNWPTKSEFLILNAELYTKYLCYLSTTLHHFRMFCHVMEFTRHNLDKLFASAKKLTPQTVLSPVDGKGKEGEGEASVVAARGILALVESLVRALDMKYVYSM